ncbi:MAG: hypothetical protein ACK5WR_17835 [Planctomycetaceae bacterium]
MPPVSRKTRRGAGLAGPLLALTLLGGLLAVPVQAARKIQNGPIKLQLTPLVLRGRSQALLPVLFQLNSKDPELLRGTLEIRVNLADRLVHRIEIPDFVVVPGETRFRMTMPEVNVSQIELAIRVTVSFRVREEIYDLGEQDLVIPIDSLRQQAVVSIEPKNRVADRLQQELRESLLLHRFAPPETDQRRKKLVSVPSTIDPLDLPPNPLPLLGIDLIVIEPSALSDLKPDQLRAIASWVRAGGSVCVVCPPQITSPDLAEFLNSLVPTPDRTAVWQPTGTGQWEIASPSPNQIRHGEPGLGRAVILEDAALRDRCLDNPLWDESLRFLWRITQIHSRNLKRSPGEALPLWTLAEAPLNPPVRPNFNGPPLPNYNRLSEYAPVNSQGPMQHLSQSLRPQRLVTIPVWQFAIMLLAFLLAVSLGDYYLLGALRLRRWTWLLLPAVSLGVTWFTARIAENSLGDNDAQAELLLVDVGRQGLPVRTSRFQLTVAAQPKTLQEEVVNGLLVNETEAGAELARQAQNELRRQGAFAEATLAAQQFEADIPLSEGLPPYRYTFEQRVKKWSPLLTRLTRVGPPENTPDLPWAAWGQLDLTKPEVQQQVLRECHAREPEAAAWVVHRGRLSSLGNLSSNSESLNSLGEFLLDTSGDLPEAGFFQYVSQVSPSGHSNLEDLRLLDSTDPNDLLLMIAVPRDNNFVVFRFTPPRPVPAP